MKNIDSNRADLELVQHLVNEAPFGIFWKDKDSSYMGCNTVFSRLAGLRHPSDIIGKTDSDLIWKHHAAHCRDTDLSALAHWQKTGTAMAYNSTGHSPHWHIVKMPLCKPDHTIIGIAGFILDLNENLQSVLMDMQALHARQHLSEQRLRQMSALHKLNDILLQCHDVAEALAAIRRHIADVFSPCPATFISNPTAASAPDLQLRQNGSAADMGKQAFASGQISASLGTDTLPGKDPAQEGWGLSLPLTVQDHVFGMLHVQGSEVLYGSGYEALNTFAHSVCHSLGLRIANMILQENLHVQSLHDPLTGLFNRRYLDATLPREIKRCAREGKPLTVVMIDIDHFKRVNDTYGHEAGDVVLRDLSTLLEQWSRSSDIVCRYGGEEFTIIMGGALPQDVLPRLNDLRMRMSERKLFYDDRTLPSITISLGVANIDKQQISATTILDKADRAMYLAKQRGRNRIVID